MRDGRFRFEVGERVRMLPYGGEVGTVTMRRYGVLRPMKVLGEIGQHEGVEYSVRRFEQGYSVRMRDDELEPE